MAMLCASVIGPTIREINRQIDDALSWCDLVELRLDLFDFWNLPYVDGIVQRLEVPVVLTLRSHEHGGKFCGTIEQRCQRLESLIKLQPAYLDVEIDTPIEFVQMLRMEAPQVVLIRSYHDFMSTPSDLNAMLANDDIEGMVIKVMTYANTGCDALRMLHAVRQETSNGRRIIGMCMGEDGVSTRILAPWVGSAITFAAVDGENMAAPGQLQGRDLLERYRYRSLTDRSAVYGLIGDPVAHSMGHRLHNACFAQHGLDAVYVKWRMMADGLANFFEYAEALGISGLSVTMPLKEAVIPYLDEIDDVASAAQAVNTIIFDGKKKLGYNTDAGGALDAIEVVEKVAKKRMVIIGAGATARAIAYEAKKRGAKVLILNRTEEKALSAAKRLGCKGAGLGRLAKECKKGYQILVNATPIGMDERISESAVGSDMICPDSIVMDVVSKQDDTPLLQAAKERGCHTISGREMFVNQAVRQFNIWFPQAINSDLTKQTLYDVVYNAVAD
ncbi:shikimate dehydrogenase [Simkania negevensis]|uniref:Multifunctional fusion protein n=1 Tax=Simkania negevensis TaxID=83561 RepID=A0ABS3AQH5_9BACT|nr:shikimate dehydrogenase [Simkania negevensis]